mgnify:CR=1 FL=1
MEEALVRTGAALKQRSRQARAGMDWPLVGAALFIVAAGLVTMNSFVGDNQFFWHQLVWVAVSLCVFFIVSSIDFHFLRRTGVIVALYGAVAALLIGVSLVGTVVKGAQSWFHFGFIAFEPSDPAKLVLVLLLAKYFSRRHVEIAHIRHILISGFYTFLFFAAVFIQPDFGAAIIFFLIWLGMVLVSGISRKHLALVFILGSLVFSGLWIGALHPYQKQRIMTFLNPLTDIHGAGYNAFQSTIAVGSGELLGKGVGYGTQSRLRFLPEYQTDFIFAAFAEEWGFVGVVFLFLVFGFAIFRIVRIAMRGETNFEMLYGVGFAVMLVSHFALHVGINIGLLPVTGTTIPFMSYGGSHLLTEFAGLGILMSMHRHGRAVHRSDMRNEFLGT